MLHRPSIGNSGKKTRKWGKMKMDKVVIKHKISSEKNAAEYIVDRKIEDGCVEFIYLPDFEITGDEFVFFPACCYDGNRFKSLKKEYPPMFDETEVSVDMPVTVTDIIRLNEDGSGRIEVTTGDVSVPCVGLFSARVKKAVLLFALQ